MSEWVSECVRARAKSSIVRVRSAAARIWHTSLDVPRSDWIEIRLAGPIILPCRYSIYFFLFSTTATVLPVCVHIYNCGIVPKLGFL